MNLFPFFPTFRKNHHNRFLLLNHFCSLESTGLCVPSLHSGLLGWPRFPFSPTLGVRPVLVRASKGQAGTQGRHRVRAPVPSEAPGQSGEGHPEGPVGLRRALMARDSIDPGWRLGS